MAWLDDRQALGEQRVRAIGEADGFLVHAVFNRTRRNAPDHLCRVGKQDGARILVRRALHLEEIRATGPRIDRARIGATTEEDVRQHQIEDGENPHAALPPFRAVPNVRNIRAKLRMTQERCAAAIGVPVATVRNWEQFRTGLDPAVRSLLLAVEREPEAVLRALRN